MKVRKGAVVSKGFIRGIAERETGLASLYYGFTTRIPNEDYPGELEKYTNQDMEKIFSFLDSLEDRGKAGEIIERYEALDFETEDVLVTWRVPVHI